MKIKKLIISEEEKKDIKKLYGLITEQQESTYGQCNGSNEVSEPVIQILQMGEGNKVAKFRMKGFFGASRTSNDSYNIMLTSLKNQIVSKLDSESSPEGYNLEFVTIDSAVGSASNYYNGPLKPTYDNDGNEMSLETIMRKQPYKSIRNLHGGEAKDFDKNTETNNTFASQRVQKLLEYIRKTSDETGISVSEQFQSSDIITKITDTGGCIDEKRDTSKFPNAGQYVDITGTVSIRPNPKKCMEGLKVIVGYFAQSRKFNGILFPQQDGHGCVYATFDIYANGEYIGTSNMNNIPENAARKSETPFTGNWATTQVGIEGPNQKRYVYQNDGKTSSDPEIGKVAYTVFTEISVPTEKLKSIASKSENGIVNLTMKPNSKSALRDGKAHGDAPMVAAYKESGDGKITSFYGPKEPYEEGGDVTGTVSIGSFAPCKQNQQ